jgi:hypothetical protein
MSTLRIITAVCAVLALLVGLAVGCTGKARQAFAPNFGSSLVAVHQAIDAVGDYQRQHGAFPFFAGASTELEPLGLSGDAASLVQLLDTNATPVALTTNTICIISIRTTEDSKLGTCRYAGLLSGEVVLLPVGQAVLGGTATPKTSE